VLQVGFKNTSKHSERLLKYFADLENLPIWLQLNLTLKDGTPVSGIRGGGKINLRGPLEYTLIAPGDTFYLNVNVADLVTAPLQEGTYLLSLTYRNQYGDNCFKGELNSNTLEVAVQPEKQAHN
jgi:hypothetical protein